jgi:hypothetical protein
VGEIVEVCDANDPRLADFRDLTPLIDAQIVPVGGAW